MDSNIPYNARHLVGDTYVVPGLTNAGFVRGLAIDTCEDDAPYAVADIDLLGITHGHADHFAVAHVLRANGSRVAAARDDASLVENPDINIRGMFSWAKPGDALTTKLFRGVPCEVDEYLEDWGDSRATTIPLPGHTMGHTGFLTLDGVLFTGDALYLTELWERHPLPYAIDPGMVATSLETIRSVECSWVVPAHGRPIERAEVGAHVDYHLTQLALIEELLLERLSIEKTTEQAVALVSEARGLSENPASYWLAVTTVKGFLGELLDQGLIEFFVREHAGWWRTL
ncbi:MAG: MBL fold metallo-hydrolase [Actinobacteria bacterium HGW-Actinobacteria-1]|jgi:glyoxylase-like metal-dependent hydrolase (beta-lactamase superfamily II)|nr:MAG: MBL fold metallo-hydrolase [Actinobacteria bacterium HGW-Actinobacteria-1]